ncbi:MAG: GTPase [Lachnospiraceae bacterium]|nr:GTPase [Lachnospiraceae bacterium]
MADIIKNDEIPVFLINGFLDAGKTSFIAYTIGEDYFHIDGNTLLIVGEEGETEYDAKLLKREHTTLVTVESREELTKEYLAQLGAMTRAELVLIEYNGMWPDPGLLDMPDSWVMYQQITVMDGSTLGPYLANMRALMGPMLRNSELCIVNRCDGKSNEELQEYKKQLRPMLLKGSMIVMENKYGEIELATLDEDLPYDVSGSSVVLEPEDYGTWFFDAKDYPERYQGKTIEFTAQIRRSRRFESGVFVPGRMSMTCCENDMTFLGYLAYYKGIDAFRDGAWVRIKAQFEVRNRKEYDGEGPFLMVQSMSLTGPISEPAGF